MKIVAVDFETSGLDVNRNAPVSIGMAIMDGDEVLAEFESLFGRMTKKAYEIEAMEIHGISWKQIKEGPEVNQVFIEVQKWIKDNDAEYIPVVSHNAKFDCQFWDHLAMMCGSFQGKYPNGRFVRERENLKGPWYCTMRMCDRLRFDESVIIDSKLDTVAAHFGLSRVSDKHGALEDAILCGRIFHRLMETK